MQMQIKVEFETDNPESPPETLRFSARDEETGKGFKQVVYRRVDSDELEAKSK